MMKWWPETFKNVKQVCIDERPDFLLSDLLADSSVDVARELDIPLAMSYPQMPIRMLFIFLSSDDPFTFQVFFVSYLSQTIGKPKTCTYCFSSQEVWTWAACLTRTLWL